MGGVCPSETFVPTDHIARCLGPDNNMPTYVYCTALILADSLCGRHHFMIYVKLKRMQKVRVLRDVTLCRLVSACRLCGRTVFWVYIWRSV